MNKSTMLLGCFCLTLSTGVIAIENESPASATKASTTAASQEPSSGTPKLKEAVLQAIEHNPTVQEKWHGFLAAGYGYDASRSGYRPKIDMGIGYDFHRRDYTENRNYDGAYGEITLKQMLYDGSATQAEVAKFNNLQLVSYFNLLEAMEKVAYEAFAAYQDVERQRELVVLARDNLAKHHQVYKQVEEKAKAGVARSVDFEQVNGRLALAQANLVTEMSNLHDISARYLRIVGAIPAAKLDAFEFTNSPLPATVQDTLLLAYQDSPVYHATLRNILATESTSRASKSDYLPKLYLNARYGSQTYDGLGYENGQSEGSIGVELRYNLYNGNSNRSTVRKNLEEVNIAKDLRDQACLDVRQNVQVAFNDTVKLAEQLPILNRHRLASAKVSTAYKQQFDIGQRTLLDVLDIENELFQASRAYTNARYDLTLANAKTLAATGTLTKSLQLQRSALPSLADLGAEPISVNEAACPAYDLNAEERKLQDADLDGVANVYDQCPDTPTTDKVDEFGCSIFLDKEVIKIIRIPFGKESILIERAHYAQIEDLAKFLRRFPKTNVDISGHSSLGGPESFNLRLSQARAEALAGILVAEYNIDSKRVKTTGFGTQKPLKNEKNPEADLLNQRIEAKVTAITTLPVKR
jgi:adhesin transport system outer membrane protein